MVPHKKDIEDLITGTREFADIVFDPIVDDDTVALRCSEGLSALYDILTAANEHYAVKRFQFTLSNGDGTNGLNEVTLPTDFYKELGVSLFLDPNGDRRRPVFPITMSERDASLADKSYLFLGDTMAIVPPFQASGKYELFYVPLPPILQRLSTFLIDTGTSIPPFVADNVSAGRTFVIHNGDTVDSAGNWVTFSAVSSSDVGAYLITSGCAQTANNGTHKITSVGPGFGVLHTDGVTTSETFNGTQTAHITAGPADIATWTLKNGAFTQDNVGLDLVISGASNFLNNGTFTITTVLDNSRVQTAAGYPLFNETLSSGVIAKQQAAGTIYKLPQIYLPWYEFIQAHAASVIRSKREQNTTDMDQKVAFLAERIQKMAVNRKNEGGQIPLTRSAGNSVWEDPKFGVLGP